MNVTTADRVVLPPAKRAAYAAVFATALTAAVVLGGPLNPLVWAGMVLPDLALLSSPQLLRTGVLDRRAVRTYNLAHHPAPAAVLAVLVPPAGLAWLAHIAMDRTVGYGPRAADGTQRGY